MARGDGIHRTSARNAKLTTDKVGNAQAHNEREKDSYVNQGIVPERTGMNVHFKSPTADYTAMFDQMVADGIISTRGLKADADKFGELIFDINSAYFYNHGGYDFAKEFYENAYRAAVRIGGGEQYILSAVMHADERNRAMSEALGENVYHYHLHVVYIPVVEKQILWSKWCKDKSLVGTVKETIQQVSMSKKWDSKLALDENGELLLTKSGKKVLRKSYSVLQDDFYGFMRSAGYTDVERGERGSSEEHLTVTQFKVEREQERLEVLEAKTAKKEKALTKTEKRLEAAKGAATTYSEIENTGKKTITGNVSMTQQEAKHLKTLAQEAISSRLTIHNLKDELAVAKRKYQNGAANIRSWKNKQKIFWLLSNGHPRRSKHSSSTFSATNRNWLKSSPTEKSNGTKSGIWSVKAFPV